MYNIIKEQFKKVITYSQGIPDPQIDKLFSKWEKEKSFFIKAFGNQLIYEFPKKISVSLDQQSKHRKINEFLNEIDDIWGNNDLINFIYENKEDFFNNSLSHDYIVDDETTIEKGTKIIKAFKYFVSNKEHLIDIQNIASRIIQENKIEGHLCFSVHPLDFLSLSENQCNWRSCHALDGEYRGGDLSYMIDHSTFICYLKSSADCTPPNFPIKWNNKKWRMLLFLSEDHNMLMAGRPYPFSSDELTQIALDKLREIGFASEEAEYNWYPHWSNERIGQIEKKYIFDDDYYPVGGKLIPITELVKDNPSSLQFNDLIRSSCYKPIYTFRKINESLWFDNGYGESNEQTTRFKIGGAVPCLRCGVDDIIIADTMQCVKCEIDYPISESDAFSQCASCGQRIYTADATYFIDLDGYLCEKCVETESAVCHICGEQIYIGDIDFENDDERKNFICRNCKKVKENKWPKGQLLKSLLF